MEIKSFVLYTEYYQHISHLSDNDLGKLFRAIFNYIIDGKKPTEKGSVTMAFSFIKTDIDNNIEKYRNICERNKTNGNKRKKKKKASGGNSEAKKATGLSGKPNAYDNDSDNDNDNDSDNKNKKDIYTDNFLEFYTAYPLKKSKQAANKVFDKVIKKTPFEDIMTGLEAYKAEIDKKKTKQEYIKHPSTWLNSACWQDEYDTLVKKPIKRKEDPPPDYSLIDPKLYGGAK